MEGGRTPMQYLDLEDVRAGMLLGQNVHDSRGQVLLPAGCALTDALLRTLHEHRVARVAIEPPAPAATPGRGEDAAALDGRIAARFRFCDERHPVIDELRRLCRLRSKGSEGGTDDD